MPHQLVMLELLFKMIKCVARIALLVVTLQNSLFSVVEVIYFSCTIRVPLKVFYLYTQAVPHAYVLGINMQL